MGDSSDKGSIPLDSINVYEMSPKILGFLTFYGVGFMGMDGDGDFAIPIKSYGARFFLFNRTHFARDVRKSF